MSGIKEWILVLAHQDVAALGAVRDLEGLRAATHGEELWVRGISIAARAELKLQQLPTLHTYMLDEQERLFPPGKPTPIGQLPRVRWRTLKEFMPVTLPVSAMPGALPAPYPIQLAPCSTPQEGNALLTDLATWKTYAEGAPQVRLQPLRFAVSENNTVLILGTPLPPVPGREYFLRDNILLPCGFEFDPPVIAALVARKLNPQQQNLLLFDTEGQWEQIPPEYFVPCTRSAIRLTKERRTEDD
ncbi:hypothetical protein F0L74_06310 [Chitinophaga agrisoli]|uniref:MoxR-vWA-beta-propeller ternary system domain-containing protein n=1 Tax=Chitinophaga agrisoli TaxID=2607653 RepID=A0A5B2W2H1_9BACT|nr:hypothetical protein [Chitinophaga agrisoli]KAA2245565.1 hypothetical protein F0L74_06310 [Chitinophaga agrisoli]